MLFKQWRAGERKEERGRERLSAERPLGEWGLRLAHLTRGVVQIVLEHGELALGGDAVLHLVHTRQDVIAHVEPELAQLPLFDQGAMFPLAFPRRSAHALAARDFVAGELRRAVVVGDGAGDDLLRGELVLVLELLLLLELLWCRGRGVMGVLLLRGLRDGHDVIHTCVAVTLAFAALPLSSFLPLMSLAGRLIFAGSFAGRCGHGWEGILGGSGLETEVHGREQEIYRELTALQD